MFEQYKGVWNSLKLYWSAYGGLRALFSSPYLHIALLLTCAFWPLWTDGCDSWHEATLSVLPNLLGFTLGGYAILLAFGDDRFRQIIAGEEGEGKASPFMVVNASFIHFIILQALALIVGVGGKAQVIWGAPAAFIGTFLFLYALLSAVAAGIAVLNLSSWFDDYVDWKKKVEARKKAAGPGAE